MATALEIELTTRDGQRAFQQRLASQLRAQDYAGLEAYLRDELALHPSPISKISLQTGPVTLSGWEEIEADILSYRSEDSKSCCSAIEVVLYRAYSDDPLEGPWLVVLYYSDADARFHFSKATREEILAKCESNRQSPWKGSSIYMGADCLRCPGLAELSKAIEAQRDPGRILDSADVVLSKWWRHYRIDEAVRRDIATRGLAVAMPVLISSDAGPPYVTNVAMASKVSDHETATQKILLERSEANRRRQEAVWREKVDNLNWATDLMNQIKQKQKK